LADGKTGVTRSERKPRHGWFDYEVLDVFGDDLGPYGITVYMVLARLCYGSYRVTMGVRELAAHARMSKSELARTLKTMIDLGLVVEHKGRKQKSVSSYDLMDVKDLVEEVRSLAKARVSAAQSVPMRDRSDEGLAAGREDGLTGLLLTDHPETSDDAATGSEADDDGPAELEAFDVGAVRDTDCPSQGQMEGAEPVAEENPEIPPYLSQSEAVLGTDLSQSARPLQIGQETRNKKVERPTPTPPHRRGAEKPVSNKTDDPEEQRLWATFIADLQREMHDVPIGVATAKRWTEVDQKNRDDFKACFSAWWLLKIERGPEGTVFQTYAHDEVATEAGLVKYRKRLTRLLSSVFNLSEEQPLTLTVLRAEEQKPAPANADADTRQTNGEIPRDDREAWEHVQRLAKEHLERLVKRNPGIQLEWWDQAIAPAQLVAVDGAANGKRVWKLHSPSPATARTVLGLLERRLAVHGVEVEIVVVGSYEGESP
jgi:hypothetical protein